MKHHIPRVHCHTVCDRLYVLGMYKLGCFDDLMTIPIELNLIYKCICINVYVYVYNIICIPKVPQEHNIWTLMCSTSLLFYDRPDVPWLSRFIGMMQSDL